MLKAHAKKTKSRIKSSLAHDFDKIKYALADAGFDVKDKTEELIARSVEKARKKSLLAQENFENYTAQRPYKALSIALVTGLVVGWFINK